MLPIVVEESIGTVVKAAKSFLSGVKSLDHRRGQSLLWMIFCSWCHCFDLISFSALTLWIQWQEKRQVCKISFTQAYISTRCLLY